jgi:uncharacterized membrane protein YhaH (DUF805 family)
MDLESLYLSSQGRISRKVYWVASLPLMPLSILGDLLMRGESTVEAAFLALILLVVVLVPTVVLSIKRCHDRDRSGWFLLLYLIPLIGSVWLLIDLGFLRGSQGPNRFGPDPTSTRRDAVIA